jgi:hypothetical protein
MLLFFYNHSHPESMKFVLHPWPLLLLILAGWINRQEQDGIEYLRAENQVLQEKLGKKRILLNDDHRRRLAVKGKILGRKMLEQMATIVTPDTILRWHRELVAANGTTVSAARRSGVLLPRLKLSNSRWAWPVRTQSGDTIAYKAQWPTLAT